MSASKNRIKPENKCIVCGSELSGPLFEMDDMPVGAQAMPDRDGLKEDKGIRLPLCRCPKCGLVQFDCEPPEYYKDAVRMVGLSETMKELRREDFRLLSDRYGKKGGKWLECGCGNGDFLKVLSEPEFDVRIYGTENSRAFLAEARKKVPNAHLFGLFPDKSETDIPGAPFDVFLSFNFLEHQPDPTSMLKSLYRNLKDDGIGLITVPSFEYIIEEGRYYELVRDHIGNYDMRSLERLCTLCGFETLEKELIGIGDTIRIVVRKARNNGKTNNEAIGRDELNRFSAEVSQTVRITDPDYEIRVLRDDHERMSRSIQSFMDKLRAEGKTAAMWGAGHQGFTIASTTVLKDNVSYIIDSSPEKQGRFAPASHLPIVSPEDFVRSPADVIIISAPGYVKEIGAAIVKLCEGYGIRMPEVYSILELG